MINLTLLNKALVDENVSDKEFRTLYLILNNLSMNKTNSLEIYNGFLMDKLNIGERQVRNITNGLAEKGYIIKKVCGNSKTHNGNIYQLVTNKEGEMNGEMKCEKNCPPYNKEKELKKELYVNKPVEVQSEKDTEIENTSKHNELKGEDMVKYTHQEVRELNEIYSKEWKELEETRQSERNTSKYNEINEWVGKKLSRGYDLLKSFRSAKTLQGAKGYEEELFNIIEEMKKADAANAITEKQSSAFEKFINTYNDAVQNKIEYFNRSKEKAGETKQSQMARNGENAQDHNLSNEEIEKAFNSNDGEDIEKAAPTPATPSRDELVKQGKRVTWDIQEMAEKAQELASSELSDETINEKVDEWVYYHTAAVPTTVVEIYKSMMKNKISGLRATGTQNTVAA